MQLSILMGTNRTGLLACSRIAQACSWASPNVEIIVRDNSGDAEKRELLAHFRRDHCNIILADPCDALTNFSEILRIAKGDFLFVLADDDFCFDHAVAEISSLIEVHGNNPAVVGMTGSYVVESNKDSFVIGYPNIESDDVVARACGFLSYGGPNILHYAPVRRDIVLRVFDFMNTLPFYFSFHDQIVCLLYLLNGKFVRLKRFLYVYDLGPWENAESAQQKDLDFYNDAGLDPAINKLHWILCGFEGASLIANPGVLPGLTLAQRQPLADLWFSKMFDRFNRDNRSAFGSPLTEAADRLCQKLQSSTGHLAFQDILASISGFIALSSKAGAQNYFDFWDAVINKRQLPPRRPIEPTKAAVNES